MGVPETIAKLNLVGKMAGLRLGHLTWDAAKLMYKTAQAEVPVVTGNLKSGIKLAKNPAAKYDWIVSASSAAGNIPEKNDPDREYANFVEFGTDKMVGRFFMGQAATVAEIYIRTRLPILARELERL